MTATTSKLGADMTDSQWILDVMGRYDFTMPQAAFDEIVEKLSARQPAAIDKEALFYADDEQIADWEQGKRGAVDVRVTSIALGSCNTPLYAAPLDKEASKPSAPSVEQDERVEKIRKVIGQGFQPSVTDCRALLAVIDARAASTSANVAQGAETVAEDVSLVRELQKALFYWMPSIAGEDSPAGQKAAEHAYLLVGLNDNSLDCYGDQARASLGIANRELERIGIACSDAGCPDEMEVADFIDDLYARAALTATVAPAVDAQPVAIYQTRWERPETVWGDVTKDVYDGYATFGYAARRIVYATPPSEGWRKDAERREALEEAIKACDMVDVIGADDCIAAIRALSQKESGV